MALHDAQEAHMKRVATKSDPLSRILAAARKDPQFFHDLVFSPRTAISKAPFLDRATKSRLLEVSPGTVIAGLLGHLADCGNEQTCSGATCRGTCGSDSCQTQTCGGGSCDETCANSCTDTITPPDPNVLAGRLVSVKWKLARQPRTAGIRSRARTMKRSRARASR
jgi:hypothetical protein